MAVAAKTAFIDFRLVLDPLIKIPPTRNHTRSSTKENDSCAENKFPAPPAMQSMWQQDKVNQQSGESCKSRTCETRWPCWSPVLAQWGA